MNRVVPWLAAHRRHSLMLVIMLGLAIRLLFWLWGAARLYGPEAMYTNGDTPSYVQSFLNLWQHGHYTFNPQEPMASFGRLPGYPFFIGLHYLLTGPEHFHQAIAATQILLDTLSIVLLYRAARRIFPHESPVLALLTAGLYALYPFAIAWVTITGTETLSIFFVLLWINALLITASRGSFWLVVGIVTAMAFFVREYLGVLLPITLLLTPTYYQRLSVAARIRRAAWVVLGFGLLYGWWPARNLLLQHQLVLVKPVTAGYSDMRPDMLSFLDWVHLWSNDNTYWLHEVMDQRQAARFPAHVVPDAADRALLQHLIAQANTCGSSFYARRHLRDDLATRNCNEELRRGFDTLRLRYQRRHPWRAALETPVRNTAKALFKNELLRDSGVSGVLITLLFAGRSVLVLLGIYGGLRLRRQQKLWPLLAFSAFMYCFICVYFHSLEMRYLLQADALLLLPAAAVLWQWLKPAAAPLKPFRML